MKEKEYLGQRLYFSESEGRLIDIQSLPYKRAAYSYRKCLEHFGKAFAGTELELAFLEYLEPTAKEVREMLKTWGKTSHLYRIDPQPVRKKVRAAAKREGLHVALFDTSLGQHLGWIEAVTVSKNSTVKVKGRAVA